MSWLHSMAEEKIREAIERGDFDRLPGAGKPLPEKDEDAYVPDELRISFKLLKNAGMIPEEMQLRKEMLTLEQLLACCTDAAEKTRISRELTAKRLRYESLATGRGWHTSGAFIEYGSKLRRKLTGL